MKAHGLSRILVLFFLMTGWITVQGQRQVEVPGDNFSLEGALELFKKSASPETFEKMLNNADSKVNNLDLNGDGYIDYIRVIDRYEGNVHAFILQAVVSETESQDIAVITLEKLANDKAVLQITGDEDIYGVETIIEPTQEVRTNAGTTSARVAVNVWGWPSVQYIYGSYYSAWISPWGWRYHPHWWYTWRPVAYYDYYPYWSVYRPYYSACYTHRVVYAQHIYRPHRTTSIIVHNRHNTQIAHYRSARRDYNRREGHNGYRSSGRQNNSSVRYNANGRISASTDQRYRSRSLSNNRNQTQGTVSNRISAERRNGYSTPNRSTSDLRARTSSRQQSASGARKIESSDLRSGTSTRKYASPQQNRTPVRMDRGSSGNSNKQRYEKGSSATPGRSQSYGGSSGSSNVQRSSGTSNIRKSSGSTNVQRYSGKASVQRSPARSSGSTNVQRSSGSSNVHKSSGISNARRSSGSSGVQRSSSSRSSGNANTRQSSGSSSGKKRGRE